MTWIHIEIELVRVNHKFISNNFLSAARAVKTNFISFLFYDVKLSSSLKHKRVLHATEAQLNDDDDSVSFRMPLFYHHGSLMIIFLF